MAYKYLTESGWKGVLAKNKTVKDNGLQKALAAFQKTAEDDFDERLKALAQVAALAGKLRRAKEVAALEDVAAYVGDVVNEAEFAIEEVAAEKATAEKAAEEKALKEDVGRMKGKAEDAEKDAATEEAYRELGKQLLAGLARVKSGTECEFVGGRQGSTMRTPVPGIMVAPRITTEHKKLITDATGCEQFRPARCILEEGKITFVFEGSNPPADTVGKIDRAIKYFTGKGFALRVRGEDDKSAVDGGADEEEKEDEEEEGGKGAAAPAAASLDIGAAVGDRCPNRPADVKAVQEALNRLADAKLPVDGKSSKDLVDAIRAFQKSQKLPAADGRVDPKGPTAAALAR